MPQATLVNSKSTLKGSTLSIQSQLTEKEDPIVEPFETCTIWLERRYSMPPLPIHTTLREKKLVYLEGTLYPRMGLHRKSARELNSSHSRSRPKNSAPLMPFDLCMFRFTIILSLSFTTGNTCR
jgi:hypothetical protein